MPSVPAKAPEGVRAAAHDPKTKRPLPLEMERVQREDAAYQERVKREQKTEPSASRALAYIQIDRYTEGPFRGMFVAAVLQTEDEKGRALKKPVRRIVSDGDHFALMFEKLEAALRRRVFK